MNSKLLIMNYTVNFSEFMVCYAVLGHSNFWVCGGKILKLVWPSTKIKDIEQYNTFQDSGVIYNLWSVYNLVLPF